MAADPTTIARPYAEALFERARETGQQAQWSDMLALLGTIAEQEDMAAQIVNPEVPRERLQELILDVAGDALTEEARNLVRLLAESDRLVVLSEIRSRYETLTIESQGVTKVQVRSAYALDQAQQKELAVALARRLGGEIEMTVTKDPSLIGGIEIRAGDLVIDDSVRGKLQKLANELHF
jgi:F-type H+-transporting ATPase subunit delta